MADSAPSKSYDDPHSIIADMVKRISQDSIPADLRKAEDEDMDTTVILTSTSSLE